MDIKFGSNIAVEVTSTPTSAAAHKTLARLFRKNPELAKHQRRQQAKRPSWQSWRRGGMQWHHQMKTQTPFRIEVGTKYTMRATVDVVRDLESLKSCVKVTPA